MSSPVNRIRQHRILLGLLLAAGIAFFATAPLRARLARETEGIERDTALKTRALSEVSRLRGEVERLSARIPTEPRDPKLRLQLAAAHGQLRQYREAAREIRIAQSLDPSSAEPHVALAAISDATGLPDIAVQEYRRALKLDPRHPRALSMLAYRYVSFGWNKDAAILLKRAILEQPSDPKLRVNLGLVH